MFEWFEAHQLPCLFKAFFGIDCPGCGFQTAVLCLLQGEWIASVIAYPALMPLLLFMGLAVIRICGVKMIGLNLLKNIGFVCLFMIFTSYLLKLIDIYH